jgi:2-polyprenyl-3-methyl-5-hydroxy-6-metoxy-1,4-benzoquinol methylase
MEKVNCNLCGGNNDAEVYNDGQIRVVMCNDCSLVYLNPRPSQEEYKKYYNKDYQRKRHHFTEYSQIIEKIEKKNSYAKKETRAKDFLKYLNENSRVLEIGSGWGTMLKVIRDRFNCQVLGIEISELAAQVAKKYYSLDVRHQMFEEYLEENYGEKFNLILMVHVLEHFSDPNFILKRVVEILSDDGYLYIAVPNLAAPDEPLDGFFRMEHCYYFTLLTLNNLLKKCGLKIIEIKISPNDIRIIAVKKENSGKEIDTNDFEIEYGKKEILKIIKKQARKYKFLRFGQKVLKSILPEKIFNRLKKVALNALNS